MTFSRSSPNRSLASVDSRARIQLMLPRSVLISPLWQMIRYGWASSQLGKVLVEKREWTSASAVLKRSSREVRVVPRQLRAGEHALVDDRLRAEARDREVVARRALDHAADHVDLALERVLVAVQLLADEDLPDRRLDLGGARARHGVVHRHVAPAEQRLPLRGDRALDQRLELGAARIVVARAGT